MKKLISAKLSGNIILASLGLMLLVHLLILLNVIPYTIVWGGQIKNQSSLFILEGFAAITTLIFMLIISIKIGHIQLKPFQKVTQIGIWILFIYLLLNTIGNLASGVTTEKLLFTPITILLALLTYRVASEKNNFN